MFTSALKTDGPLKGIIKWWQKNPLRNRFAPVSIPFASSDPELISIHGNIRVLFRELERYTSEELTQTPEAEQHIRQSFEAFLENCGFHDAEADFQELLAFKSSDNHLGKDNFRRNDGTINWYHELIPILGALKMAEIGKEAGGFDLKDLEQYGGLETFIRTILLHDAVEDWGIDKNHFAQTGSRQKQSTKDSFLVNNVSFLSRKSAVLDSNGDPKYHQEGTKKGKMVKKEFFKSLLDYIYNQIRHPSSNPIIFMAKQGDGIHNIATLHGAKKFGPEEQRAYCNGKEDMYGARNSIPEHARKKWPEFANAILTLDQVMACTLYSNFGWLEQVDQLGGKFNEDSRFYELGFGIRHTEAIEKLKLPHGFSPMHILYERLSNKAQGNKLAQRFLDESLKPALRGYERHFPALFDLKSASAHALPARATYAPMVA